MERLRDAAEVCAGAQVENLVADRHSDGWLRRAEHAEWKVLDGEIGGTPVGCGNPTPELRIVCLVHCGADRKCFFKPCQHSKYSCCRIRDSIAKRVGRTTSWVSNMN